MANQRSNKALCEVELGEESSSKRKEDIEALSMKSFINAQ